MRTNSLAASKEVKKELFNVLFVNQMCFDLYSSVMLVITYFMKIFPVRLTGTVGYLLCALIYGETITWFGLNGSMLNLAAITVERYVKIVFSVWHKSKFRPWMVYSVSSYSHRSHESLEGASKMSTKDGLYYARSSAS